jgi:hypothetical protein
VGQGRDELHLDFFLPGERSVDAAFRLGQHGEQVGVVPPGAGRG